jgi:hypothetical protein
MTEFKALANQKLIKGKKSCYKNELAHLPY